MRSAEELRKLQEETRKKVVYKELSELDSELSNHISKSSLTSMDYYGNLSPDTINHLMYLGYSVDKVPVSSQLDSDYYIISWQV